MSLLCYHAKGTDQGEDQVILKSGDSVKFDGVLVSIPVYREMQMDIFASDEYKSELQTCLMQTQEIKSSSASWFFAGTSIGFMLYLLMPMVH